MGTSLEEVNAYCLFLGELRCYDGYASCPLMVSMNRVILAEFNYDGPIETFPINQAKPTRLGFWCKRYILPFLYWDFLLKGRWHGPATIRKIVHLGFSKAMKNIILYFKSTLMSCHQSFPKHFMAKFILYIPILAPRSFHVNSHINGRERAIKNIA
ncbi:hypothetical protein AB6A40_011552 [Gnathostoma spinigerum]|uniref:Maturase K n=1 Tax=Gnathostoma spinigerum TaxID=75299 RepID=A0ABD6EYK7_9BILA